MSSIERPLRLHNFLGRRFASDLLDQITCDLTDLVHRVDHVDRYANRATLVGDGPRDRLADPPGRIRAELVASSMFELVDGSHQARVSFLDQVQERQSAIAILFGDRNDQAKIAGGENAFGSLIVFAQAESHCLTRRSSVRGVSKVNRIR